MESSRDILGAQREWQGRAVLLMDLDAFFASVEQLDHPQWRGKPVIVGGQAGKRGVVSTCSYEARAFGVRSAMPSSTAARLCPQAIWVEPHFKRYRELSAAVMGILYDESPLLEQVSIDEAFLDVSPGRFVRESPVAIAARIQQRVSQLGITCSIGVASGKSVAKIASDLDKPRGLTVVYPGSERAFLAPMEAQAMPGIGKQSALKLQALGIRTLGDLAAAQPSQLKGVFGVNAAAFVQRAAGIDERPLVTESEVKSISNERTFTRDLTSRAEIEAAIDYLGCMVGRRLRKQGLAGHTVTLKLRYSDLSSRTAQHSIGSQVDDESVFIPVAKQLLGQVWRPGDSVRLVGIGIGGFHEKDRQMELFGNGSAEELPEGNPALMSAADKVRDRFGDGKLVFGRQLKLTVETTANPNRDASS
ncbi:MAG: DNA polymerase IV [Coriobacteriales bacterium]